MSLYKIIKAAEVPENLLQVVPLRRFITAEEQDSMKSGDYGADLEESLMEKAAAQAEEIVKKARANADKLTRQAELAAEQIKQKAYQDAFEKGRQAGNEAGYQEGIARAEEQAATIRAQAAGVLEQAEKIRRHTLETLELDIVNLARDIAEKLMSAQLSLEPGMVMQVAAESLRLVSERRNVVLYINPIELELVENRRDMLKDILPAGAQLHVIADPSIQEGGCRVETEQGWVDATMETRRKELIKALYGNER
jgi:flagellar assembly protein FliH